MKCVNRNSLTAASRVSTAENADLETIVNVFVCVNCVIANGTGGDAWPAENGKELEEMMPNEPTPIPLPMLKPCPFCGGEAKEFMWPGHVGCANENCGGYAANLTIEQWNTRVEHAELTAARQQLQEVRVVADELISYDCPKQASAIEAGESSIMLHIGKRLLDILDKPTAAEGVGIGQ